MLARGFQPLSWQRLDDGRVMLEERAYDHLTGRSKTTWTLLAPDGSRTELRHSVRVYRLPELRAMLGRGGLETVEAWGGWDGEPYGFEGGRLIVHARKPA